MKSVGVLGRYIAIGTVIKITKTLVEGLQYYKDNREFVLKVTADFAQKPLNPTYDVVICF